MWEWLPKQAGCFKPICTGRETSVLAQTAGMVLAVLVFILPWKRLYLSMGTNEGTSGILV